MKAQSLCSIIEQYVLFLLPETVFNDCLLFYVFVEQSYLLVCYAY